ncbi:hypothetical protein PENTCL1PPCAC_24000, partial [Pristionchus entomophagus]
GGFRGGGGGSFGGGGGRGLSGSRSYSGVYGWRHSSAPLYMHGGYSPLVVHPFYGCHYCYGPTWGYRFMTGHYVSYNNYHYYSDKKYLPKDTSVSCTRPTSDLPAAQLKNLTHSTKETPKEMAWACPAGNTCCGWECCKEPVSRVLPSWASGLIVFGIFIGVVILIG